MTGSYSSIGSPYSGGSYNAMGYDTVDNYLYAIDSSDNLLRIAGDGSITNLGVPSGLASASYIAGDFDDAGHLIVRDSATQWFSIDPTTNVATSITITGAGDTGNDLVYVSGVMYVMSSSTLYRIDLSTDVATSVSVTGAAGSAYGAAWTDSAHDLYFSDNGTGKIYEVTGYTGSSPSANVVLQGAVTSDNDGAACQNAASTFSGPTGTPDAYTLTAGTTDSVDATNGVLANDVGTSLTVASHTDPSNGSLTLNADGSFSYTPTAGYHGDDSFTYTTQDEFGRTTSSETVDLTVNLPAAPQANDDSYSTAADSPLIENAAQGVLANDSGSGITVTSTTPPTHGMLSAGGDGSFTYTPAPGYSGLDSFDYTITDAYSRTSTATVDLTVTPVANDDLYETPFETPLVVAAPGVLSNDVGTGLTVVGGSAPSGGSAAIMSDGTLTYTPDHGYVGTDTFLYTVQDSAGNYATAVVSVVVDPPAAPQANDDAVTAASGATVSITDASLLSNDTGGDIHVTANTLPSDGTLTPVSGGFQYSAPATFSGYDSFTYTITDALNRTSTATVDITVMPVAQDVSQECTAPAECDAQAPAPNGSSPFTYSLVQSSLPPTSDGTVVIDATSGQVAFQPALGFAGPVPAFQYTVTDFNGLTSAPANVSITIDAPAAPVANADSFTTTSGATLSIADSALLSNDTGAGISVSSTTSPSGGVLTPVSGGFDYVPPVTFSGTDTFTYTITDAYDQTSTATVTILVAPVAFDALTTCTAPAVCTLQVPAPNGTGPFTYTLTGTLPPAQDGTLSMDPASGLVTFTPAADYVGSLPGFTYTVTDASNTTSAAATVNLVIDPPAPPLPHDVWGTTAVNHALTLTPPAPGGVGPLTFALASQPPSSWGSAMIDASTGAITFTPAPGVSGTVPVFTYRATDRYDDSFLTAAVHVTVVPAAPPLTGSGLAGTAIHVAPPQPQGTGPFTYALVQSSLPPASEGSVTIDPATGAITFVAAPGYTGVVHVEYTTTDASGVTSAPATVSITVSDPVTPPTPHTGAGIPAPLPLGIGAGLSALAVAMARRERRRSSAR